MSGEAGELLQEIILASRPEVQALPALRGLILVAAAADAKRSLVMRLQEPFAHLANMIVPHARLVPRLPPEYFTRSEEWVRCQSGGMLGTDCHCKPTACCCCRERTSSS